jgi:hypothetical protein
MEPLRPNSAIRLWTAIKNLSSAPHVYCRIFTSYDLIPLGPFDPPGSVDSHTSDHGCNLDREPLWMLLPGETRFESVEMPVIPNANYNVQVLITLAERSESSTEKFVERPLEWTSSLAEAVTMGTRFRTGDLK